MIVSNKARRGRVPNLANTACRTVGLLPFGLSPTSAVTGVVLAVSAGTERVYLLSTRASEGDPVDGDCLFVRNDLLNGMPARAKIP